MSKAAAKNNSKKTASRKDNPTGEMSLTGHLRELKNRIVVCIVVFFAATVIALQYASDLVDMFIALGEECNYQFVYLSPQELLLQYFRVALTAGLIVTIPVLLYEIWAFVSPGLKKRENLLMVLTLVFGTICFIIGILFAYRIMLPFMLVFLDSMSVGTEISAYISIEKYLSFLLTVLVIFGVVFELPVVSVLLNRLGILKVEWMKKARRVVIVVIFIIAALITPPDIVSQVMVALPMMVLYEISILLCSVCGRIFGEKNRTEELEEEEEEDDADGE